MNTNIQSDQANNTHSQRKGEFYAVALTFIEAWFPIMAAFAVTALGAIHAYFYSLLFACVFLFLWWLKKAKQADLKNTAAYKNLFWSSFYITTLYIFLFVGLNYTSAINVSIIMFLQILFGFLFLSSIKVERLNPKQFIGAVLMTIGALVIIFPGTFVINAGDILVLFAAMVAPIANLYQKKARAQVSSETILLVRSVIALPFIFILALVFEPSPNLDIVHEQLIWLILIGLGVFTISKILWIEAIYLLPITKVNALFAFTPLLTMTMAYLFLEEIPTYYQLIGVLPVLLGSYLITVSRASNKA